VTVMPTSAIQRGAPGTFVYLISPDNTVAVKTVDLGPQSGERVAVRSGLSPGDRVVIDGADKLRNGAKVVVRESPTGGQGRPAAPPAAQTPPAAGAPAGAAAPAKDPSAPAPSSPTGSPTPPTGGADGAARQGGSRRSRAP
jgi:membrane fusion protein, multidrug efflux system